MTHFIEVNCTSVAPMQKVKIMPEMTWWIKLACTAALMMWLISGVDIGQAVSSARQINPFMLCISFMLALTQVTLGGLRWWIVLQSQGQRFSLYTIMALFYAGVFVSSITPGALGGDVLRAWQLKRLGLPLSRAIVSVLLERILLVLGLMTLSGFAWPILYQHTPAVPGLWVMPLITLAALATVIAFSQIPRLPTRVQQLPLVMYWADFSIDIRGLLFSLRYAVTAFLLSMIAVFNIVLMFYVLACGIHIDVSMLDCLALVPPVILILTLPISISGWGVRETSMVIAFGFIGVPAPSALALSVAFGLVTMISALPGGLMMMSYSMFLRGHTKTSTLE